MKLEIKCLDRFKEQNTLPGVKRGTPEGQCDTLYFIGPS
jgi:hypothetical protein